MGKRSRQKTTQSSNTSSTIDSASRGRINQFNGQADNFLAKPFNNYVQGLSANEQRARQLANDSVGSYSGNFDRANEALGRAGGTSTFNQDVDVSRYTNPFESQVIDANNADFQYGLDRNTNDINARVALDGGYGGSGHALGLAEAFGQSERARNSQNAGLRYQNYESALDRDFRDRSTDLQNQQFNLQNQQNIAGQYANLAQQQQAYDARDIGLLDALGATDRGIAQNQAQAEYQDGWQRYNAYGQERQLAGGLADRFGTSNGTQETVSRPSFGQQLGGALGGIGGLFSSGAVGGISSLFGFGGQAAGAAQNFGST